jgi:hypothetical protein
LRIEGKLIKRTYTLSSAVAENNDSTLSYTERLERCLLGLCRELGIPVPLWLEKNTREFARFKRTFFFNEQFEEKVGFDRFEIRVIGK